MVCLSGLWCCQVSLCAEMPTLRLEILRSSEEQFVHVLNEMNTTQARRRDASYVMWMVVFWTGISLRHGVDGLQWKMEWRTCKHEVYSGWGRKTFGSLRVNRKRRLTWDWMPTTSLSSSATASADYCFHWWPPTVFVPHAAIGFLPVLLLPHHFHAGSGGCGVSFPSSTFLDNQGGLFPFPFLDLPLFVLDAYGSTFR